MSRIELRGHGITAGLPDGWEGAILRQPDLDVAGSRRFSGAAADDAEPQADTGVPDVVRSLPVVHLASFALPEERGDFGSGAVDAMGAEDVFVALVEYGPESVGTPLFSAAGLPTRLRGSDFARWSLQRAVRGQAGLQHFATVAGRAFCLYVVIGDADRADELAAEASRAVAAIAIDPPPQAASAQQRTSVSGGSS